MRVRTSFERNLNCEWRVSKTNCLAIYCQDIKDFSLFLSTVLTFGFEFKDDSSSHSSLSDSKSVFSYILFKKSTLLSNLFYFLFINFIY